jgi:hypothetical protein
LKRFLKVIAVFVIIWIAVTGYFITQHTVEAKEAKLNQTIVFDDLTLNLDSIVFYNFKRERPDYTISEFKYSLVSKLPEILVWPYLRINYLYSTPYEINGKHNQVALFGKCLYTSRIDEAREYLDYFREHVSIMIKDSKGISYSSGIGTQSTENRQEIDFSIRGRDFPIESFQEGIKVIVKHLESGEEREFEMNPQDFMDYKHNDSFGKPFPFPL